MKDHTFSVKRSCSAKSRLRWCVCVCVWEGGSSYPSRLPHVLTKHMNGHRNLDVFHCDGQLLLLAARHSEEEQSCAENSLDSLSL